MQNKLTSILLLLILTASPVLSSPGTSNLLVNGDFESSNSSRIAGWQVKGKVELRRTGGKTWQHFQARFNAGKESLVQVVFEVKQGSTGTLWLDNFRPSGGISLVNPSLEDVGSDGKPTGWSISDSTASLDTTMKNDGQRSLKITHKNEAVPSTYLIQKFAVEPGKQYSLDMDVAVSEDFGGEARMLIFNSTAAFSMQENLEELLVSELVAMRDRCGSALAELFPAAGIPVSLDQQITTTPNRNLSLTMDIQRQGFAGTVKITASDTKSGDVLKSVTLDSKKDQWENVSLPLVSQSGKVSVNILAEGTGRVRLDNVEVSSPRVMPDLQYVRWLQSSENYRLPTKLGVKVEGAAGTVINGAIELLSKDLGKLGVSVENDSSRPGISIKIGSQYAVKGKGPESYRLTVNRKGVSVSSGTQSGAFYGVMTLLQLIASQDGKAYVAACEVTDYPDFPIRAMMYADAEQSARWKSNMLFYSTGYPDTPAERADLAKVISKSNRLNLKLVPFMMGLSAGYYVESKNPNLAVGIWQKDEQITLSGTSPTSLKYPWVIRTGLTDIVLKSSDGAITYEAGKDYTIIDGDMHYNYDQPNPRLFTVSRTTESRIPDGGAVLASYDYVSHFRESSGRKEVHIPYCFEEPQVKELMAAFCRNIVAEFKLEYINVAHDLEEFPPAAAMIATDSRTINAGKNPIDHLVESLNFVNAASKQGNAKTHIVMWAGTVNDFSKQAVDRLSKDMIVNVWGYDASFPIGPGKESIEFWMKHGFQTMGLAWHNLRNVRSWAQIISKARKKGYPCLGLVGSAWPDLSYDISSGGLMETARVSWRVPRKGDKGYVQVPEMVNIKR